MGNIIELKVLTKPEMCVCVQSVSFRGGFSCNKVRKNIFRLQQRNRNTKHMTRVFAGAGYRLVPGIFSTEGNEQVYFNSRQKNREWTSSISGISM